MTTKNDAYQALENAITTLTDHSKNRIEGDAVPVDAVLIIGYQAIDDDGDRTGRMLICPRSGSQPLYITKGLITQALDTLRHTETQD